MPLQPGARAALLAPLMALPVDPRPALAQTLVQVRAGAAQVARAAPVAKPMS